MAGGTFCCFNGATAPTINSAGFWLTMNSSPVETSTNKYLMKYFLKHIGDVKSKGNGTFSSYDVHESKYF